MAEPGHCVRDDCLVMTLAEKVVAGDRRALARAITLVESTRSDHRAEAADLLDTLLPQTGTAMRVGVSGAPGVGKSVFIEASGLHLVEQGHKVAVLAVDPSSVRSGGSILGDKTRMEALAREPNAFIRPSPSGGTLGGVARRTREVMLVCEAAGFDTVLVETVGVGQSEAEVDEMVDVFVLLVSPGAGDELQGIKRGITELADVVVVTKADGDLVAPAQRAAADYRHALHLVRARHSAWTVPVLLCSALQHTGIAEVWAAIVECNDALAASGERDAERKQQTLRWLWAEVTSNLVDSLRANPKVSERLNEIEDAVTSGELSVIAAARALLDLHRT
jgi:LAO/AO transport system kinase